MNHSLTGDTDWKAIDRDLILDSMLSGRAYGFAVALCEVGEHRFAGSPGDLAAVEWIQATMAEIGLSSIQVEPFPVTAWERGHTELVMVSPVQRQFDALALAGTVSAHAEGELVDVGYGMDTEFATVDAAVQGWFVLTRSDKPAWLQRGMYRGEKILRAQEHGAIGVLISNAAFGLLPLTGFVSFGPTITVPAISISYEVGEALRRRLRVDGAVRLRLDMEHQSRPAVAHNIMGDIRGQAWPDQSIMVGAHYDSHDLCAGARDDAGGVGIALEIARLLANCGAGVGRSIRFIGFGAEELGLLGAEAYVQSHEPELDSLGLVLNLDCAGRPGSKNLCVNNWPTLRETLRHVTGDISDLGYTDAPCSTHMDHFQFFLQGVPTATLAATAGSPADPKDAYHHTSADTLDKLTPEDLQAEALRAARALVRLSWVPRWPASRRSRVEVERILDATGMRESLTAEGRSPFGQNGGPAITV